MFGREFKCLGDIIRPLLSCKLCKTEYEIYRDVVKSALPQQPESLNCLNGSMTAVHPPQVLILKRLDPHTYTINPHTTVFVQFPARAGNIIRMKDVIRIYFNRKLLKIRYPKL